MNLALAADLRIVSPFGEEISGERAAVFGLAWKVVPGDKVDGQASQLARRVAADPELARCATATYRMVGEHPGVPWPAAIEVERSVQDWSLRRRHERQKVEQPR